MDNLIRLTKAEITKRIRSPLILGEESEETWYYRTVRFLGKDGTFQETSFDAESKEAVGTICEVTNTRFPGQKLVEVYWVQSVPEDSDSPTPTINFGEYLPIRMSTGDGEKTTFNLLSKTQMEQYNHFLSLLRNAFFPVLAMDSQGVEYDQALYYGAVIDSYGMPTFDLIELDGFY